MKRHIDAMDVTLYLMGRLNDSDKFEIIAHLEECPQCSDLVMEVIEKARLLGEDEDLMAILGKRAE